LQQAQKLVETYSPMDLAVLALDNDRKYKEVQADKSELQHKHKRLRDDKDKLSEQIVDLQTENAKLVEAVQFRSGIGGQVSNYGGYVLAVRGLRHTVNYFQMTLFVCLHRLLVPHLAKSFPCETFFWTKSGP